MNLGGGAAGTFAADTTSAGGSTYATTAPIDTSGVAQPAPQAVYQTARVGDFTITIAGLSPGAAYVVRLHFAELYWSQPGQRVFDVAVNGSTALPGFDI